MKKVRNLCDKEVLMRNHWTISLNKHRAVHILQETNIGEGSKFTAKGDNLSFPVF